MLIAQDGAISIGRYPLFCPYANPAGYRLPGLLIIGRVRHPGSDILVADPFPVSRHIDNRNVECRQQLQLIELW